MPEIWPKDDVIGFDQEIRFDLNKTEERIQQNFGKDKKEGTQKHKMYKYTLNKAEIPTPFQGEHYDIATGWGLKLTKELLGPDCTKAEIKVISFRIGQLPSFVGIKTYKMVANKNPIKVPDGNVCII